MLDLQEVRALQVQLGQLATRELQVLQEIQVSAFVHHFVLNMCL